MDAMKFRHGVPFVVQREWRIKASGTDGRNVTGKSTNAGARRAFWLIGAVVLAIKLLLVSRVPIFGDEAWYAWEARQLAWSYSDLPGLTAWLIRIGIETAGQTPFGLRWPFLVLATMTPWLIVRAAIHAVDERAAWLAGCCAWLLPLLGSLGFLALPDVPLTFAFALGWLALLRLREGVSSASAVLLAISLVVGALSHYRFVLLLFAGGVAACCDPRLRSALRDVRVWAALLLGAAAWLPLLWWNMRHGDAGVAFQFSERHPWAFHADGAALALSHVVTVGVPLLCALLPAIVLALRHWREGEVRMPWRVIAVAGGVPLLVYCVLAFFADRERVSFHWTLQAWLPWLLLVPVVVARWSRAAQRAFWNGAGVWCVLCLGLVLSLASPAMRERLAAGRWYPDNFSGWQQVAESVGQAQSQVRWPLIADNFMLGAQLAFALPDEDIRVLDHPLNAKHGRAVQLELWNRRFDESAPPERFRLVVEDSAVPMKNRLRYYHGLCGRLDGLPPARQVLNVDRGRKRFLLFDFDREPGAEPTVCRTPALAWIDAPAHDAVVENGRLDIAGWAFADGIGLARVEVVIDGDLVIAADYGLPMPNVAAFWEISTDATHPDVGFHAAYDVSGLAPGEHWIGLRLVANDGRVEEWPQQRFVLR